MLDILFQKGTGLIRLPEEYNVHCEKTKRPFTLPAFVGLKIVVWKPMLIIGLIHTTILLFIHSALNFSAQQLWGCVTLNYSAPTPQPGWHT